MEPPAKAESLADKSDLRYHRTHSPIAWHWQYLEGLDADRLDSRLRVTTSDPNAVSFVIG
jgi:hypothetical protein